ncbi:MAG TPA: MCE family protein [Actinophytocola sp.]|uniref:MCE family protein n=1 Tax=Actinophytocola sp. TaxID=1872138 RepID=UPI002DDCE6B2|nr:MCE family protein [Actinophytocola sp.]HEV2784394.1 MCE family protein [Actinophytocola sp.]
MLLLSTKVRLFLFALIAVAGIAYVGGTYAGLDRLFLSRGYRVTAQFADSGGIFTNAEVTYRGVAVGRVTELRLSDTGIDVILDIEDGAPPIPADTRAIVANRSAVGEQYVDLVPDHDGGPHLADGSVIPRSRTAIPSGPETLLSNLDNLVASVPTDSLRTVVDELDKAFRGTGPAMQVLLDSAGSLTDAATRHLPKTTSLLANGRIVLQTQSDQAQQIKDYSRNLRLIAEQLKQSDPDLRSLITSVPVVSVQVDDILRDSGQDLGIIIANLLTTAQVTSTRIDGLEHMLVAFPMITATSPGANPDGTGHLGLVLTFNDPFSCTRGYEGTHQRPANQTTDVPTNQDAYCAEPPGSPIGVRGSQNAPFGGKPQEVPPPAAAPAPAGALPGSLSFPGLSPTTLAGLLGLI